jgi:hypothetical protein
VLSPPHIKAFLGEQISLFGSINLSKSMSCICIFLEDFRWLARELSQRPIRLGELLPGHPIAIGTTDAAAPRMGGIFFTPSPSGTQSFLWRAPFAPQIQAKLMTWDNPTGSLTNSNLELAGAVAQHDIIAQQVDVREYTIHNCHDNTPAVYWQRKGSTTTTGPAAYLLRLQAIHQRHYRYHARHDYLPGDLNKMADICSRAWHLSDAQLLTYFNSHFPQSTSWQLCQLRPSMSSGLTSALFTKRSEPESLTNVPEHMTDIGNAGRNSASSMAWIHNWKESTTQSPSYKSLAPGTEMDALPPVASPCELAQWRTPFERWARGSPAWGPKTSGKTPMEKYTSGSPE